MYILVTYSTSKLARKKEAMPNTEMIKMKLDANVKSRSSMTDYIGNRFPYVAQRSFCCK